MGNTSAMAGRKRENRHVTLQELIPFFTVSKNDGLAAQPPKAQKNIDIVIPRGLVIPQIGNNRYEQYPTQTG